MDRAERIGFRKLWIDPKTRVLVARPRAIPLTILEHAIFVTLRDCKTTLTTAQLVDIVYHGARSVSGAIETMHLTKRKLNDKLALVGLRVVTPKRANKCLWRLVAS